ncbi:NAD(P)-binding protein [Daldinia vernicosa]|uniref:NAD(P)-binding protein n=1 Tax=Daldinia vernicosa TaxID=114800 RepID=UPI002008B6EE|nr:NAD(P)-binding protein [Daldinia vernicosa]KAI0852143.1 NAD(P)-binding protein [Daldinia vernicosa]
MKKALSKFLRRFKPGHPHSASSTSVLPSRDHPRAIVSHPHVSASAMASNPSPSPSLRGKVALITGASKGIGKASAIALARLGATVIINYSSDEQAAQDTLTEVQKLGVGEARLVRADASSVEGVQSLVKQTVDAYSKIDILVPNAGVLPMKDLEHTTEADFDRTFAINVKGPYFLAQAAAPHMSPGSHIIFLSSTLTTASTVMPGYLLYNSTKGAIEQMTRVISKDLGRKGILVNAVAPGPTGTELFYRGKSDELLKTIANFSPQGRIGTPEEIAEVVVFLAHSTWVSGQVLRANGGMA